MSKPVRHRRNIALLAVVAVILIAVATIVFLPRFQHLTQSAHALPATIHDVAPIRLARPDAMIASKSLRDLPSDLLKVPLLKAVLTEDFVFYYQQNSHLLGIEGTLRRIAYEHHLSLRDDAVAMLLDRPADIALWRGNDGRLSHWMIDTTGPTRIALLKLAARLVGSDPAIKSVGEMPLTGDDQAQVYSLDYGRARPVYLTGVDNHLVVFSDLAMFKGDSYGDEAGRTRFWRALLTSSRRDSPLRSHFGLQRFSKHALIFDANAISFHYQHFAPDLEALRFDFDGKHWVSYLRLASHSTTGFATSRLWHALPDDPGLCAGAPLDWSRLRPALQRLGKHNHRVDPGLAGALGSPAAVCWFADGSIYTPLVLVPIQNGAHWDDTLTALFATSVGNSWPRYRKRVNAAPAKAVSITGAAHAWRRRVPTDYGTYPVTLARAGGWLVFSPDVDAVRNTVAAIEHQRPAISDRLPSKQDRVIAVITPHSLSTLLQHAVEGDLPAKAQPLFHKAAAERLLPRLKALADFPPYALALPSALDTTHRTWQQVSWHVLSATH